MKESCVRDTGRDSVRDSVRVRARASVRASASARASVRASVRGSVRASARVPRMLASAPCPLALWSLASMASISGSSSSLAPISFPISTT